MSERVQLVSQISIKVDGTELQPDVMGKLIEVSVDQHTHLPHMFSIRLTDPKLLLLDEGPFDLTKEVEISASKDERGNESTVLIKGEITALEPEFNSAMNADLVVRGFDKSHRLYRETKSRIFLNVKDSDLASEIARSIGLQAEIDPPTSVVYDHIYQHNQSDLAFLMQRAWRIGYECFVADGKLYFRKPANEGNHAELTWGDDLLAFHLRATIAEQVKEVLVKGWDVERQKPIIGRASSGKLYPDIEDSKDGATWAAKLNSSAGKLVIVDLPVVNQAEADTLAAARLDEISGAFIEADGVAFRRPDIQVGKRLSLLGLGKRFSGSYLVTSARHVYNAEGLTTYFSVCGTRQGLLSQQLAQNVPLDRWPGVVIGVVTNLDDPKRWGRVKVKFPWMSEDAESDWARVTGSGAGHEAGHFALPEVGDEVLVAFVQGDFSQPVVLGGLWNGKAKLPPEAANPPSGANSQIRTWRTHKGHRITLNDKDSAVEIDSIGKIETTAKGDIKIDANGALEIKAKGNINIETNGNVTIKGTFIDLNP